MATNNTVCESHSACASMSLCRVLRAGHRTIALLKPATSSAMAAHAESCAASSSAIDRGSVCGIACNVYVSEGSDEGLLAKLKEVASSSDGGKWKIHLCFHKYLHLLGAHGIRISIPPAFRTRLQQPILTALWTRPTAGAATRSLPRIRRGWHRQWDESQALQRGSCAWTATLRPIPGDSAGHGQSPASRLRPWLCYGPPSCVPSQVLAHIMGSAASPHLSEWLVSCRLGIVDHISCHPIGDAGSSIAVEAAHRVGEEMSHMGFPVYFYGLADRWG